MPHFSYSSFITLSDWRLYLPPIFRSASRGSQLTKFDGRILKGNLAPGGAVAKITGKEGLGFVGKARVFDTEDAFVKAVESGSIKKGEKTVVILRYLGPVGGPGEPFFQSSKTTIRPSAVGSLLPFALGNPRLGNRGRRNETPRNLGSTKPSLIPISPGRRHGVNPAIHFLFHTTCIHSSRAPPPVSSS